MVPWQEDISKIALHVHKYTCGFLCVFVCLVLSFSANVLVAFFCFAQMQVPDIMDDSHDDFAFR